MQQTRLPDERRRNLHPREASTPTPAPPRRPTSPPDYTLVREEPTIGHHGTFLASLDLWDTNRVAKPRPIQSNYRALWSVRAAIGDLVILEGPVVVVDARSLKPGNSAHVLIHPMQPEAWLSIDAGATLVLHGKSQRLPEIGTAVILDRHQVPASAPLHFDRIEESPSVQLLVRREKRLLPWRR